MSHYLSDIAEMPKYWAACLCFRAFSLLEFYPANSWFDGILEFILTCIFDKYHFQIVDSRKR
jgi:hypothetical protein